MLTWVCSFYHSDPVFSEAHPQNKGAQILRKSFTLLCSMWLKILSVVLCFIGIMFLRQLWRKAVSARNPAIKTSAKSIKPISTQTYNTMSNLGLVVLSPKKTPQTGTVIFCHRTSERNGSHLIFFNF